MTLTKSLLLTVCAVAIGFTATPVRAAEPAAPAAAPQAKLPFSEDQRAAMEDFVRNFILDNPEVLMESVNRFQAKQEKGKEEASAKALKESSSFIYNGTHPEIGNPKGDVTLVEFFDYNCGYCKRAMVAVRELVEKDKNVRVIFMDYPILSAQSTTAAKWAIAANKQGKYWAFHQAMLESSAPKDDENMSKIATSVGLDVAKLKKDAQGKDVDDYLASVKDFGMKLNIQGTPGFIAGEQIIRGFVEYEAMKTIVEGERKKAKK